MSDEDRRVLRDPLCQLNTVVWLVTETPSRESRPVLLDAGYLLHAIAPRLTVPPEVRERLAPVVSGEASPDVVLTHTTDPAMLIIECKAGSFGPRASQSQQALMLLAVGADLSGPLGARRGSERPGHVVYLVPGDQAALMDTLDDLKQRLKQLDVASAPASCLALDRDERGLLVGPVAGDRLPDPAAHVLRGPVVAYELAPDDDPRPLYLVPWDPSVTQEPDQVEFCRRQFGGRILNAMTGRVGRMRVPATELTRMDELLEEATLGVSRYWRDPRAVDPVQRAAQQAIVSALQRSGAQVEFTTGSSPIHVQLTLSSEDDRDAVIAALEAADDVEAARPLPPPTIPLFDTQELA